MIELKFKKNEILTLLGIFCFLYPVISVLRTFMFGHEKIFVCLLADFLVMSLAYVFSGITSKKSKTVVSAVVYLIIVISAAFFKSSVGDLERVLFEIMAALVFYIPGFYYRTELINNFFNNSKCNFAIVTFLAALFITYYQKDFFILKPYVTISAYIYIAVYLLESNRYKLEWAFRQNGVDGSVFSSKIRSYNSKLALFVFLLILLFSNIILIRLIFGYGIKLILILIMKIVYYFNIILGFLLGGITVPGSLDSQTPGAITQMHQVTKPKAMELIMDIIIVSLLLYLLYKLLPYLIKRIVKLAVNFIKFVKGFISRIYRNQEDINDEYEDSTENIQLEAERINRKTHQRNKRTKYNLDRISNPVEKIRCMYRILLEKIRLKNILIGTGDTTGEIYRKSLAINGIEPDFKELTNIYELVRYRDEIPDSKTLTDAHNIFDLVSEKIKKHKS